MNFEPNHFSGWMPHGYCVEWDWRLLGPFIAANALITLAYFAIPVLLFVYLRRAKHDDLPPWTVWAFITFILCCGAGHLVKVITIWFPWYWLATSVDWLTAVFSVATACALPVAGHAILSRPSRDELTKMLHTVQRARANAVNPQTVARLEKLALGMETKLREINSGLRKIQR
jgi:hypothetical protein